MEIRDLILSSGLTMKELLLMKRNWREVKKEIRGENRKTYAHLRLKNYIESIADWVGNSFSSIFISVCTLIFIFYEVNHNLNNTHWILLVGMLVFFYDIWSSSRKLEISIKLSFKLMLINVRIKTRFVLSWIIPGMRK